MWGCWELGAAFMGAWGWPKQCCCTVAGEAQVRLWVGRLQSPCLQGTGWGCVWLAPLHGSGLAVGWSDTFINRLPLPLLAGILCVQVLQGQ